MSEQQLFTDFPPITTEQWEEKIKQDLKGVDYEKKLVTKTLDGIRIKPYYRSEDLTNLEYLQHLPGDFPFVRSAKTEDNYFDIRQNIFVENFSDTNIKTKDAGAKGANSIGFFICHKENITENEFNTLISGINPENTVLNFISGKITPLILKFFINHIEKKGFNPEKIKATFSFDPFGHKTITGNCYNKASISKDFEVLKEISEIVSEKYPQIKFVNINGIFFTNAGATVVEELAFALASANETLAEAEKAGLNPETLIPKMMFTFGVGSNYFIEIAKIRAARLLWAEIVKTWSPETKDKAAMFINSVTSDVNKTAYDAYVNQLRTTTEAMSAVIGGTDCLTVNPFDITYKKPDDFSERIARNIGIILKEEAHFDKSIDPAAGSYYLENLTNDIAENVWNLFLKIEELGGYHNALKQNFIQDKIKETVQKRDLNIATRKEILLGTNQYPNFSENIKNNIDLNIYNWQLPEDKNTDTEPIKFWRAGKAFEELRLAAEKSGKRPKVFLLTFGNLAMRKARATFSTNFFACAGYEIIDNAGFASIEEGVTAAINAKADIVTVCGSDDDYPKIIPEISNLLNGKAITVVAGYPKNSIEELKTKGIEHFIHVKSNVLETLQKFNEKLL